ncbi:MAG: hypothetical protein FWH36_03240 [Lentimicrobiaceae bacterium]|nr:hypothetical protein [Lentimicrobiaceae bacterium]
MDEFFGTEEDELEDFESVELISRYENMVRGNYSTYLSADDYENLFIHYAHFYSLPFPSEYADLDMAGMVIRDGVAQYPDACLLQLFAVYYRFLTENLSIEKTIKLLEKIDIQEFEKTTQTYFLASIYAKINAVDKAIALYQKLLEDIQIEEEKIGIYSDLIFLFDKEEDIPKMLEYYEKSTKIKPKLKPFLLKDLYIYFLFKPELGVLFFESYTQQHYFSAGEWHCLGELYAVLSMFEKAVEAVDNAVALSDNGNYLVSLAEIYGMWGKNEKALEYFHEALSLDPKRTDCYLDIADLYCSIGQFEVALRYYGLSRDAFPNDVDSLIGTAIALGSMKKYEEALSYLNKIQKMDFVPVEALLLMTDYLIELERNDEAITLFEQMTELFPQIAEVWLAYSNYYASYDNYARAYAVLKCGMFLMKDKDDSVVLMYRMANYYFLEGKNDRAISFLETAYLIGPNHLDIFLEYDDDIKENPLIMDVVNGLKAEK